MMSQFSAAARFVRIMSTTTRHALRAKRVKQDLSKPAPPEVGAVMEDWARHILQLVGVEVRTTGAPIARGSTVLVGNHLSYLDIPVLMSLSPVVFVAKSEIARWPVFGHACRSVGTVFVTRNSPASRKETSQAIARTLRQRRLNVGIFPSGTTSLDESKPWRWGAFQIARQNDLPVQPFRLRYEPARATAFIDDDELTSHLWNLLKQKKIVAELEFLPPRHIKDPATEGRELWHWAREAVKHNVVAAPQTGAEPAAGTVTPA